MVELTLYTPQEIRVMISKTQREVAKALSVDQGFYSKLETGKRVWSLDVATKWLGYVLGELDKLEDGVVDFSRVLDFHDLNTLNKSVDYFYWWEITSL